MFYVFDISFQLKEVSNENGIMFLKIAKQLDFHQRQWHNGAVIKNKKPKGSLEPLPVRIGSTYIFFKFPYTI